MSHNNLGDMLQQGLTERPFWKGIHTASWFTIIEAEFKVANITNDLTRYSYVISQLDEPTLEEVKDIVCNPPITRKYSKIKEELIRRFEVPETERMRTLFEEKLEDRTPSQFYRRLRSLAGTGASVEKFLLHLWLRQLPVHCQEILASRFDLRLSKLAELADKIMETSKGPENSTLNNTAVDNIQQCIDDMGKQVVALEESVKRQSRSRSPSAGPSGSQSPTKSKVTICWYHTVYGESAYRCVQPCSWKKPEEST